MAQQKLYRTQTDVEATNWEKRHSDFAFQEINQKFESQRLQLHIKQVDGQVRLREVCLESWD